MTRATALNLTEPIPIITMTKPKVIMISIKIIRTTMMANTMIIPNNRVVVDTMTKRKANTCHFVDGILK